MKFQDQAEREWLTWRQVCRQLEARGIVPNDEKNAALMTAIKLWAEELHVLLGEVAAESSEGVVKRAREQLREKYEPSVIGEWAP